MRVGEKFPFAIEWRDRGGAKPYAFGSIVPALAKDARTGHPLFGWVRMTQCASEGRATRPSFPKTELVSHH